MLLVLKMGRGVGGGEGGGGEPRAKECGQPFRNWKMHGSGFSPRASRKGYSLADTLVEPSKTQVGALISRTQFVVVLSHQVCGDC